MGMRRKQEGSEEAAGVVQVGSQREPTWHQSVAKVKVIAKDIGRGRDYRTLRLIYVEDGAKENPRTNERFPN